MSDIDFDELDKAVNTLMSDVPKVEPPKTDDIKTLTINSTLADDSRPSFAALDSTLTTVNKPVSQPTTVPTRAATPPLAARRGGRFMDVVHPSSDMKTTSAATTRPTSRQGVTIEPSAVPPQVTAVSDQADAFVTADNETSKPEMSSNPDMSANVDSLQGVPAEVSRDTPKNDWPDPLEMSGYEPESVAESNDSTTDVVSDESATPSDIGTDLASVDELEYEDPQPLTSPFITDAKVEKRPLGGAPVEEPGRAPVLGALAAEDESVHATDPADQLPATPGDVETQLPPELQSDLMAIETDGDTSAAAESTKENRVEPSVSQPTTDVAAVPAATVSTPDAKSSANSAVASGPTSIPQQYQEAPSTSDEQNGSIYDTASYHQPLAHPAKTKSGWLWVIWILLLLIVGGGGAVALYFIGII